jgi:hypothetical protein
MTNSYNDMPLVKAMFFIGSNAAEAHPVAMQHVLRGKENGAKLIVCDPRFTRTAAHADQYIRLRSGTDVPLIWGILWHVFQNGWEDKEFINQRVFGMEQIRAEVAKWPPEVVQDVTGVPPDQVKQIAQTMAENRLPGLAERREVAEGDQQVEPHHGRRQHQGKRHPGLDEAAAGEAPIGEDAPEPDGEGHQKEQRPQRQDDREAKGGPVHAMRSFAGQDEAVATHDLARGWLLHVVMERRGHWPGAACEHHALAQRLMQRLRQQGVRAASLQGRGKHQRIGHDAALAAAGEGELRGLGNVLPHHQPRADALPQP